MSNLSGDIVEKISEGLKPVSDEREGNAAVVLMLKPINQDFEVFFVKRATHLDDPWSGHMAFPGGKRDAKDRDLKQTAVRETLEETSINLLDRCRFLGVMESISSKGRPEMKILPFVVLLEHKPPIKLSDELEWFIWISLEELVKHKGTFKFRNREFPAYIVGDIVIWGLTYRILEEFLRISGQE